MATGKACPAPSGLKKAQSFRASSANGASSPASAFRDNFTPSLPRHRPQQFAVSQPSSANISARPGHGHQARQPTAGSLIDLEHRKDYDE
jgi:hypothetical protein